ncbi:MAG: thiamine phosphate synthase [Vulcanimicrobiaceae bacterium]
MRDVRLALRGIYAIVNEGAGDPVALADAVLRGGVRIVQYRSKRGVVADHVRALRLLTRQMHAVFIVNDDWHAALAFDADGVHLGPGDDGYAEPAAIRTHFGDRLIGLSCGTPDEAGTAVAAGVDYLGVGAVYATASKPDAGTPIGVEGLCRIVAHAGGLPTAAIGGITESVLPEVRRAGAAMAAVLSALGGAADPLQAAERLVRLWESA